MITLIYIYVVYLVVNFDVKTVRGYLKRNFTVRVDSLSRSLFLLIQIQS